MITQRFEHLFRRLVGVFRRYHDTPRMPTHVAELGAARWDLELARKAIAEERERIMAPVPARSAMPLTVAMSEDKLARLRASQIGATTS